MVMRVMVMVMRLMVMVMVMRAKKCGIYSTDLLPTYTPHTRQNISI